MGCGVCCLKCLLILFNVITGVIGLVLLAAGAFILAQANDTIKPLIDSVIESIPGLPDSFSLADAQTVTVNNIDFDVAAILKPIAVFLVIIGTFLLLTSIFGAFGACCSNRLLLYIYAAILIILFVIQLLVIILFFTGALDGTIKSQFLGMIKNEYVGIDDYTIHSLLWNVIMTKFKCCGVNNVNDFNEAKKWKNTRKVNIFGVPVDMKLATPFACCKFKGEFPNLDPIADTCAFTPTPLDSNKDTGCWDPMWEEIDPFMAYIGGAAGGIVVFQALCAVAAIFIAVQIQKEKEGQTV